MENTDGWDSLGHPSILSAIDEGLVVPSTDELASQQGKHNINSEKTIYLIDT